MEALQIKVGAKYRVRLSGLIRAVKVVRESTTRGRVWRCVTDTAIQTIVPIGDFLTPLNAGESDGNGRPLLPVVRGGIYLVSHDSAELKVEAIYPSCDVHGGWIVRQVESGSVFTIHERDVVHNCV